jgi:hypothetical protein
MREQRLPVLLLSSLSTALPLEPSLKIMLHRGVSVIFKENFDDRTDHTENNNRKVIPVLRPSGETNS